MTFEQLFGHMRSMCHALPSSSGFEELVEIAHEMYALDSEQFAVSAFPYMINVLQDWPENRIHNWPLKSSNSAQKKPCTLLFCELLEDMLDHGFDIQSHFVRDYCIHIQATMSPHCLNGVKDIPLELSRDDCYNFEQGKNSYESLDRYTEVRKLLVRYLMMYEQTPSRYEALYSKYIRNGHWNTIPRLGDVGPQHGLFECELHYIKTRTGLSLPEVVSDFYQLFGRLSGHALGNADNVIDPYAYIDTTYRGQNHIIVLWENQGGWDWGYELSQDPDPRMILFTDIADGNAFGTDVISEDAHRIFASRERDYMFRYDIRFSDFVRFDRTPWEPDAMSYPKTYTS